ncbi:CLUMA_CG021540, isoform A [Clunio marinus]|uniref:CLUMA_CG021540, isoform A n=1 Tax=Clunio marinus TaxID=568069 RepID=A0A1J1J7K9_9DIPT|nr:CLUMA_CG021540, isoform A [Clunio marinus]
MKETKVNKKKLLETDCLENQSSELPCFLYTRQFTFMVVYFYIRQLKFITHRSNFGKRKFNR